MSVHAGLFGTPAPYGDPRHSTPAYSIHYLHVCHRLGHGSNWASNHNSESQCLPPWGLHMWAPRCRRTLLMCCTLTNISSILTLLLITTSVMCSHSSSAGLRSRPASSNFFTCVRAWGSISPTQRNGQCRYPGLLKLLNLRMRHAWENNAWGTGAEADRKGQ